tara:strand:+ start:1193 stop:1936 length:744 start_codon:yes stop_codon:yes gene_type:complete
MKHKIGLNLIKNYSINFSLPKKSNRPIKFIIIHYTGMKKESNAIKRLCEPKSKVSAHYFIKNNGDVINLVPDNYVAWHAGKSSWQNYKSLNEYSIGIEINNPGHDHRYKNFTLMQISSLIKLIRNLSKKYGVKKRNILGHSDIAPNRKKDPGEKFPWKKLAKKQLGIWHNLDEKKIKLLRGNKISFLQEKMFLKNLYKIGYCKIKNKNFKKDKEYMVKAFQRHFRQELINGKIDVECLLISKNITKA